MTIQKSTVKNNPFKQILKQMDLTLFTILEFGVGNGELTNLILERNPRIVLGYAFNANGSCNGDSSEECNETLHHNKLVLSYKDFREESFRWLKNGKCGVICIPPPETVEDVKEIIEENRIENAILTIPKSKKQLFPDFEVAAELKGTDFNPARESSQLVLKKGFV